jgi:type IV pilus assembly protein PilF
MKSSFLGAACALAMFLAVAAAVDAQTPGDRESLAKAAAVNTQLGLEYMRQGNLEAARDKIEKAVRQNPHTAETQMAAGFLYDRLGDQRKALAHYEEAAKLGKDNADVLNNVAVYLCRNGEFKRGEQYFLAAVASPLYKTPEVGYTNAGRCARADGRAKDAEQYFRKALSLKPDQADALLQMAQLEHEGGTDLQARAFLQRYLAVAPASAQALWLGYGIERKMGDIGQAGEYARRLKVEFTTSEETELLLKQESGGP